MKRSVGIGFILVAVVALWWWPNPVDRTVFVDMSAEVTCRNPPIYETASGWTTDHTVGDVIASWETTGRLPRDWKPSVNRFEISGEQARLTGGGASLSYRRLGDNEFSQMDCWI